MVVRAFRSGDHPVAAHLVVTRRCNLSCSYCNEFDTFSRPVPFEDLERRVDRLAQMGTAIITLSGGEPLLHPELDRLVRAIRQRGILATLLTNGTLLTAERIETLNRAGLDQLQISIDQVKPDTNSRKCLQVLDRKLRLLAEYAEFDVNINTVLGGPLGQAEDALTIARRAKSMGFSGTVGLIHDGTGKAIALSARQRQVQKSIIALNKPFYSFARYDRFQENLAEGKPNDWHCRAGSRYLYVCEDGRVHLCSQQRGYPAIPLDRYGKQEFLREYRSRKPCSPYCTISCVHKVAALDKFRESPVEALLDLSEAYGQSRSLENLPLPVRVMTWMFLTGKPRRLFAKAAIRVFGADAPGA
ncbi:MAG: radical SAM protein [Acidobacteria bacterium]|nr:MAG: radical SAM protein [Acidobacteriota bacterium]